MNPYRKFKWNKTYPDAPDFDFIKGCETGLVKYWNEKEYVIDTRKLTRKLK